MKTIIISILTFILFQGLAQRRELNCPDFSSNISTEKRIRVGILSGTYGKNYRKILTKSTALKKSFTQINSNETPNYHFEIGFTLDYRFHENIGAEFNFHYAKRGFDRNTTQTTYDEGENSYKFLYGDYKFQLNYYLPIQRGAIMIGAGPFISKVRGTITPSVYQTNNYLNGDYHSYLSTYRRKGWASGGMASMTYLFFINNKWSTSMRVYYLEEYNSDYRNDIKVNLYTLGAELRLMANMKSW